MELKDFGGCYGGNKKPTKFLCLTLKMLQIQPEKEIVIEFIKNEEYKYVRLLGAFYLRLVRDFFFSNTFASLFLHVIIMTLL